MPAKSMLSGALETLINQVIFLDPDSQQRLAKLNHACLSVYIEGFADGITLHFSDKVDVSVESESFEMLASNLSPQHCCIKTQLAVLPELKETSQLTRLIQQKKLHLEGDINVAQHASALFRELDIDWEEQVAKYTGDVFAHQAFTVAHRWFNSVSEFTQKGQRVLANALVEEKELAAHKLAVLHFCDEVSDLRNDVERFEVRLAQLESHLS
ncbi:ubiquinone biosynthesis accessory factor UbiJ [Alteromonas sp. ASW11-130]|uniref:ubiquinone biosynthesis accessory factor UbiJ n=1 Tax=Alteromonas sp. ASW11-130 TaxID=3015775 RepID=UPI00224213B4|nr:SCP2 sterol-binding domain-containing protein [Alteromonas sp. ASW11-130]MCW8091907.1 SCP2 sterol-binding domain-containing protein [Alteromonas sp. ASW11-130]